ncbi:MAG: ParA family protein [Bacteroidota bacterium]|nr:ParA family protein [Bacteroidota bacterium]
MSCRVISVSNHKGGVGKTTSTVNLGAALATLGRKVLLIDADPQANLTVSFGIEENDESFDIPTIYDAIRGHSELKPHVLNKNLHIVPSTIDLSGADMELSAEPGREYILRELIEPLRDKYDYIFIDCPPSLGLLTINSFTAATEIFIPIQPHYLAVRGLSKILEVINKIKSRLNRELEITGVFVTLYDRRKILHKEIYDTIETYFDDRVFRTKIKENIALAEAPSNGMDIFSYDKNSNGAHDYRLLAKEVDNMKFKD